MAKVYLLERGSYDRSIVGIYSTRENAELAMDALRDNDIGISEYDVDAYIKNISNEESMYSIVMLKDGTVEAISRCNDLYGFDEHYSYWDRPKAPAYKGKNVPAALNATVWAKNKKSAIGKANKKRLSMIKDGTWKDK